MERSKLHCSLRVSENDLENDTNELHTLILSCPESKTAFEIETGLISLAFACT